MLQTYTLHLWRQLGVAALNILRGISLLTNVLFMNVAVLFCRRLWSWKRFCKMRKWSSWKWLFEEVFQVHTFWTTNVIGIFLALNRLRPCRSLQLDAILYIKIVKCCLVFSLVQYCLIPIDLTYHELWFNSWQFSAIILKSSISFLFPLIKFGTNFVLSYQCSCVN